MPAEDPAASTLTSETVEGFGGIEIGTQANTPAVQTECTQIKLSYVVNVEMSLEHL